MSWILIAVLVAVIAAIIWLVLKLTPGEEKQTKVETRTEESNLGSKITSPFRDLAALVTGKQGKKTPERFREWISDSTDGERARIYDCLSDESREFTIWVAGLSAEETKSFAQTAAVFCASQNMRLEWILDQKLEEMPDLKESAEDSLVLFSLAYWKAVTSQDDVTAYTTFELWQQNPSKKEQKDFTQNLFAALVQHKLVPEPSPDLFIAPEEERHTYAVDGIRQAAAEDRSAFNEVLGEVLCPHGPQAEEEVPADVAPPLEVEEAAAPSPSPSKRRRRTAPKTAESAQPEGEETQVPESSG